MRNELAKPGAIDVIADSASRKIASLTDVRDLKRVAEKLDRVRKVVGEVTGERKDINKIAIPMIEAIVKVGRILDEMAKRGERKSGAGGDRKSRNAALLDLPKLGFTRARASRWSLASTLPDNKRQDLKESIISSDDGLWSLGELVRAARQWQRENDIWDQEREINAGVIVTAQGPFDVIVVDPPWPYGTEYDPNNWQGRSANPYPEMPLEDIKELDVGQRSAANCILWLWTTHKFMRHSFPLLDAWGFEEKAILTWVKDRMGLGSWLRSQSEFCIMAIRGEPKVRLKNQTTVLHGKLREHSRKPDEFYDLVRGLCVGSRRYDWFAREERKGWLVGGNETNKFEGESDA